LNFLWRFFYYILHRAFVFLDSVRFSKFNRSRIFFGMDSFWDCASFWSSCGFWSCFSSHSRSFRGLRSSYLSSFFINFLSRNIVMFLVQLDNNLWSGLINSLLLSHSFYLFRLSTLRLALGISPGCCLRFRS